MKANLLFLLVLALLLAQCKKREPDPTPPTPADPVAALPAETQTGAGTFGCLVNGKPFKGPFSTSAHARGFVPAASRARHAHPAVLDSGHAALH